MDVKFAMRNNYKVIDYSDLGLPSVEVYGTEFHYQDLYEMVGVDRFMTTFELRKGSVSHEEYGDSVLGVICYSKKGLDSLERSLLDGSELTKIRAAFMFLLCSLISSTFLTLALVTMYSHYKTSNIISVCIKLYYTIPVGCNSNIMYKFNSLPSMYGLGFNPLLEFSDFYLSIERFIFL